MIATLISEAAIMRMTSNCSKAVSVMSNQGRQGFFANNRQRRGRSDVPIHAPQYMRRIGPSTRLDVPGNKYARRVLGSDEGIRGQRE
jgi:hypothetical protein